MDIGLASIVSSSIIGVSGIVVSIVYGYIPTKRRTKIEQLQKELLIMCKNSKALLEIESDLSAQLGQSKVMVRKNHYLSREIEPKRLDKRINELEILTGQKGA